MTEYCWLIKEIKILLKYSTTSPYIVYPTTPLYHIYYYPPMYLLTILLVAVWILTLLGLYCCFH